jgi:predicted FMN-binding regulatory protein PaiB
VFASESYPTDPGAVDEFLSEMRHGTLIASAPGGHPQVSILPFLKFGDEIELHAVQADPTLEAARLNPRVTFFVSDYLAWTPHHWVDPIDAGRATLHFRAVAFECEASVSLDPADVAAALRRLVGAYEADQHGYRAIEVGEFYGARLRRLATLRLRILKQHAKFKTGPAATRQTKERVIARLRERGEPGDARAADVIESYLAPAPESA